jgi:hypothetical protein
MKRAKIIAQVTDWRSANKLDMKSRLDRNLFAGSVVLFNGVDQNEKCCPVIEEIPVVACPEPCSACTTGCNQSYCHMHQYS